MSRLLLLLVCVVFFVGVVQTDGVAEPPNSLFIGLFLGALVGLIVGVGVWCRWLAWRISANNFGVSIRRLNRVLLFSRLFIVASFATAVFAFGWGDFVLDRLHLRWFEVAVLPSLLVGISPVLLAWIGLWWAQFPADAALRQQSLAENLFDGLPIHPPPSLGTFLINNIRLQILFTLAPLVVLVGMRDIATLTFLPHLDPRLAPTDDGRSATEMLIWFAAAGLIYVLAPELLRHILKTSPLPESPLRRRLDALCRRSGMRCRDILVWHTSFNVGNAAVMGLIPRFRYVLLSDLLLERMDDDQIEAVFAHEIGHVVHRHMIWYIVFFLSLTLGATILESLSRLGPVETWLRMVPFLAKASAPLTLAAFVSAFVVLFGFLSRRCERQADVYAARIMQAARPADAALGAAALGPLLAGGSAVLQSGPALKERSADDSSHVGIYGAQLFSSALHRVATINNMPVNPRSRRGSGLKNQFNYFVGNLTDLAHDWLHGSIPDRMEYLRTISADPELTSQFDRLMARMYGALLLVLFASVAYLVPAFFR